MANFRQLFIVFLTIISLNASAQQINKLKLDAYLNDHSKQLRGLKNGYGVTIIKDDKILYQYKSDQFNDDTAIPIASASKWLSAGVIMKLVDEGLISLNDPLKKFFPSVGKEKADITIRQLFSHTSALPGNGTFDLIKMGKEDMATQCESILKKDLIGKPGIVFSYGGESMQVAGRIAEIVSKKDFEVLFQERIAKPLEMKNTSFTRNGRTPQVAGGASSTINDYLHFLNMLVNNGIYKGKRVLSEASVKVMLANQIGDPKIENSPFTKYEELTTPPIIMKYGIGNWREENKDGSLKFSSSPGAFGFTPWIDAEHHYYGILGTLRSMKTVYPAYLGFRELLNNQF